MLRSTRPMLAAAFLLGVTAAFPGCTPLPPAAGLIPPIGLVEDPPEEVAPEIKPILAEIDRLQMQGQLRPAIDLTQRTLSDFPAATPLQERLAELRSQRQVCFTGDLEEAEDHLRKGSPTAAVAVLQGIERYGDRAMVQIARDRIRGIRGATPRT